MLLRCCPGPPRATGTGVPEPRRFGTCIPSSRAKDPCPASPGSPSCLHSNCSNHHQVRKPIPRTGSKHIWAEQPWPFPRAALNLVQLTKRSGSRSREELTSVIRSNAPAERLSQDFVSSTCDDKFQIKDTDHMAAITIRGLLAGKASMQLAWPFEAFSDANKGKKIPSGRCSAAGKHRLRGFLW